MPAFEVNFYKWYNHITTLWYKKYSYKLWSHAINLADTTTNTMAISIIKLIDKTFTVLPDSPFLY